MAEPTNAEIRAWGRSNGFEVSDRGRIPAAVLAAHAAAHETRVEETAAPPELADIPPPSNSSTAWGTPAPDEPALNADTTWPGAPLRPDPQAQAHSDPPRPAPSPRWSPPPPPTSPWGQPPPGGPPPAWDPARDPRNRGDGAWPPPERPKGRDGFAIAALAFGIVPVLIGMLGITFGLVALGRIRRTGQNGRGFAIAGIVLGGCWLLALAVAIVFDITNDPTRDDDGSLTGGGSATVDEIRKGDCLASMPDRPARDFTLLPCAEPHAAEVFAVIGLGGSEFPGDAEVERLADSGCAERLSAYVGSARSDAFLIGTLSPTRTSWRNDHREVHCLLVPARGSQLEAGSARAP